jgi:hypothetical protein
MTKPPCGSLSRNFGSSSSHNYVRLGNEVLFDPGGKKASSYHWNLGTETNNKVEAYALLKGVQLAQTKEI